MLMVGFQFEKSMVGGDVPLSIPCSISWSSWLL